MVGRYPTQRTHMFSIVVKRDGDISVAQLEPQLYTPWWDHSPPWSLSSADAAQLEAWYCVRRRHGQIYFIGKAKRKIYLLVLRRQTSREVGKSA